MLYFLFRYHRNLNRAEKNSFIFNRAIRLYVGIIIIVVMICYMILLKMVSYYLPIDLYSLYVFLPVFLPIVIIITRINSKKNMKKEFRKILSNYRLNKQATKK